MRSFPNFRFIFLGVLAFLALAAVGAVLLSPPRVFAHPAADRVHPAPNPRQAMIEALAASYPNPSLGDEGRTFDRLVGTWDCVFTFHLQDGRTLHKKGELLFGWILNGRAVQDIWITYPADSTKERTAGTSVRFFDTALRKWRVVFVGPQVNYLVTVQGGLEGDRIVLHGVDTDGAQIRWSFMDIAADSFTWHGEKSRDGGKTWVLEEEHHMRRRTT